VPPGTIIAAEQSAPAPPFTLASASGEPIQLADYLGQQPVVLAFYMGDF
jgi:peroxiredoxin